MDHVSSLIPSVLRKRGLYDEAHASMIVYRAQKWLLDTHPEAAQALHPHALKDGILTLRADNDAAEREGSLFATALLSFLQSGEENTVREVRVTRK